MQDVIGLAPAIADDLKWLLVHDVNEPRGLDSEEPGCTCGDDDPCPGCRWRRFAAALKELERVRAEAGL